MARNRRKRSYTYIKSNKGPVIRFRVKMIILFFLVAVLVCFGIYMAKIKFGDNEEGSYKVTWTEKSSIAETRPAFTRLVRDTSLTTLSTVSETELSTAEEENSEAEQQDTDEGSDEEADETPDE